MTRILGSILKVGGYTAFLVVSVGLILFGMEQAAKHLLGRGMLAQVYSDDIAMARKDYTRPVSHYDYDFVPGVCVELNTLKGNSYEYANNAGFRDPRAISIEKPPDEFRIFLMGGSTAYGMGAVGEAAAAMNYYAIPFNETIAHMLEMLLNANASIPGKTVRVYNTAVWGYAYQHHLMRYTTKLRQYKPDLVISLDGANEIAPISKLSEDWDYFKEGQFHNIIRHIHAYDAPGLASYLTLWLKNNTYLMTLFWGGRDVYQDLHQGPAAPPQGEAAPESPRKAGEPLKVAEVDQGTAKDATTRETERRSRLADRNVETVVRVVENLHSALDNDGVPHLFALQPWFYLSKKKHTEQEQKLASLTGAKHYYGVPSEAMYKMLIDRMSRSAREKGFFLVDFSEYFDDVSEWVFTDWCHLTAGANYLVSRELTNIIREHFLGHAPIQADQIGQKDFLLRDLASSSTVVRAPEPDSPENGPRNMLSVYPGEKVYQSRPPAGGEAPEIVLDLGHAYPVRRTRLVWTDEHAVPEKWSIEVSPDGDKWYIIVEAGRDRIDEYSQWPGFEHYAAEPVIGRYIRYKSLSDPKAPIKLRCWNVSG